LNSGSIFGRRLVSPVWILGRLPGRTFPIRRRIRDQDRRRGCRQKSPGSAARRLPDVLAQCYQVNEGTIA